ncbi:D-galactonate transporter [Sporosarcina luteola]|nr:D-galactonate transporter [Sporosarcina luteola]
MKRTRVRWLVVILLFVATSINYMDRAILGIAGPMIMEDLSLNAVQFGLLGSAFFWTYAIMQLPVGMIIDRLGARLTYTIAVIWWSLCTVLTGFGRSLGMLIGIRALMGIGEAPAFPTNTRAISDWLPPHERGIANGIFGSGVAVGVGLSTPLLAWVINNWGWRISFVAAGLLGFVWVVFWLLFFKNRPNESAITNEAEKQYIEAGKGNSAKQDSVKVSYFQFLKFRSVWGILYGLFSYNYLTYLMMTWLPTYLVVERNMTLLNAGFATLVPWIASFLGNLLGGYLSDTLIKKGWNPIKARKVVLATGMVFPIAIIPSVFTENSITALTLITIAIGGAGLAGGILWATVSDLAPIGAEGKLAGLQNFVGNLAGWIAPVATGALVAYYSSFSIALIITGAICLLASIGYIFLIKNEKIVIPAN